MVKRHYIIQDVSGVTKKNVAENAQIKNISTRDAKKHLEKKVKKQFDYSN